MAVQFLNAPTLQSPKALGQYANTLMEEGRKGLAFNEQKRQNQANNLYKDRALMQNDNQFNKTFGLNEQKVNNQVDQFGQTMDYKNKALAQDDAQFGKKLSKSYFDSNLNNEQFKLGQSNKMRVHSDNQSLGYYKANQPKQNNPLQDAYLEERTRKLQSDRIKSKVDQLKLSNSFDGLSEEDQLKAETYVRTYGVIPNIIKEDGFFGGYKLDTNTPTGSQVVPEGDKSLAPTVDNAQLIEQLKQIQQDMAKYR